MVVLMLIFVVTLAIYREFARTIDLALTATYWKLACRYNGDIAWRLRKVSMQSNTGDPL